MYINTHGCRMGRGKSTKSRYNFLIDKEVYDKFSIICEQLGLVRSRNLERYMQSFIKHNEAVLKQGDNELLKEG